MRPLKPAMLLITAIVLAAFCAAYPIYVIRPFRHQGAGELAAALFVLRYRWIAEVLAAVIALTSLKSFWNTKARFGAMLATVLVLLCGVATRINVYEQMFHPVSQPTFEAASATKLAGAEKVIAVKLGNDARAYPVRSISYHHIVNDTLGAVPIVATY